MAVFLIFSGIFGAFAQYEGQAIQRVEVEGLRTYTVEQIAGNLKTRAGQNFSSLDVRADLEALAKIMNTATVAVDAADPPPGVVVRFTVTEFPRLRAIQSVGNVKLKSERIERLLDMKPGETVLDAQTIESARRALEREYQQLGMQDTVVRVNVIPAAAADGGAGTEADLQVVLDEGGQILSRDVIIHGNKVFSAIRLRTVLQTSGSWGFIKNYYSESVFQEDLARLRDFYYSHGYFDARVERGVFEAAQGATQGSVSPVIEITEGERYTLGEVAVRGARLYSQAEIEAPFAHLKGKLFDGQAVGAALDKVTGLYTNHGLLTTEVDVTNELNAETHTVDLTVNIVERNRIYVGRVRLERPRYEDDTDEVSRFRRWYNKVTPPVKDQAILNEILLEPGEIYSRKLERESLRRLARLQTFNEQTLQVRDEPTQDPEIHDLVVNAEETVTGLLGGGVGFGDATGAFVYANLTERNVGGNADVFSVGVNVGTRQSSVSVNYLNRQIGDTRDSLATRVFYELQSRPGYTAGVGGSHVEWSHPLRDDWTRRLRARVEGVKLTQRGSADVQETLDRVYPVATLRLAFDQDTREPYGGPVRQGYLQTFSAEAGYAGAPLLNFEATRDQYIPLTERLTYRFYANAGVIPYNRDALPIHERYFLGGNADMRGFAYRGAGYFDKENESIPIGGAARILVKNELLFPIYGPVSGVVFSDIGNLGETPFSWEVPRLSAGTGLRFDMKQSQVGLDLAMPIMAGPDDDTRFFHFSLQSQF